MSCIKKFLLATFICLCILACGTDPTPQPADIEPSIESKVEQEVRKKVSELCKRFPIYPNQ